MAVSDTSVKIKLKRAGMPPVRSFIFTRRRRTPTLDTTLYMRPICAVKIGTVSNNEWATDGVYRQGTPVGKSLILKLKCGHIEIVPQHPVKLRRLVHCPMCFMLWSQRTAEERESKTRQRKRQPPQQATERIDMAKKKTAKASSDSDRRGRKVFEFVKAPKGIEDKEGTICGVVYAAIKKLKKATVSDVADAASKGLADVTEQDPLNQTGVWLNRLAGMGAVRKVAAEKASGKKATSKAASADGSIRLTLKKKKTAKAA